MSWLADARDVVAAVFLLLGCVLAVLAAVGALRFPNVLARMHATSKVTALGLLLVVAAGVLTTSSAQARTLLVLVAVFHFVTTPVAAHLIGRAAYRTDVVAGEELPTDELAASGGSQPQVWDDDAGPANRDRVPRTDPDA